MPSRRLLVYAVALTAISATAAAGVALASCFVAGCVVWLAALRERFDARWVLAVAILVRIPFLFASYHSDDLYRYVFEGRLVADGLSPYEISPVDPRGAHLHDEWHGQINHPDYATIYPPLAQGLFAMCASGGGEMYAVRNAVLVLDVLVVLLLLAWLHRARRPAGHAIVYAWSPLALAATGVGHYDPLMMVFLVAFGWAWCARRPIVAGALLGGAILAKTIAVLLLPWLLLRRPRAMAVALVVVAAGYAPFWGDDVLSSLLSFGAEFSFNASLFRGLEVITSEHARLLAAMLLLAWTGFVALTQPRWESAAVLTFAGLLALSPTVHYWYLTWFLAMLGALGARRWTWPLLAWAVTVGLSTETYRAAYAGEPFVEQFGRTWIAYLVPGLMALGLVVRAWPKRPALSVPLFDAPPPGSFGVVVPCRGEFRNLEGLLPAWLETDAARIVLADTPTGDGTDGLADGERVRYVAVPERGYGAAVQAGMAECEDLDIVVVCDADHGRGPSQVRALLAPLGDASTGLVSGARTNTATLTAPQRLGNALSSWLIGFGWGRRFHDLGPFRAWRRTSFPRGALRDQGFGWNVEMNVRALELGVGVAEVELPGSEREFGENQISATLRGVVKTGYGILRRLFDLHEESIHDRVPATVVVLTKLSTHLPVKTRLVPLLGEGGARAFFDECLSATVARARELTPDVVCAYSPADAAAPAPHFHPVAGDDGAVCLERALCDHDRRRPLIALGGDAPDLPLARLRALIDALADHDAAFVPTGDGGFSALALRRPVSGLASGFAYGGDDALASLRAFFADRGLRVAVLEPWPDIDTPEHYRAYQARRGADS